LDEPTGFEIALNYALYGGALFQLLCIFAAIVFSTSNEDRLSDEDVNNCDTPIKSAFDPSTRRGKKEKKKHK